LVYTPKLQIHSTISSSTVNPLLESFWISVQRYYRRLIFMLIETRRKCIQIIFLVYPTITNGIR